MTAWGKGKINCICKVCNKEFSTYKAWIRNGKGGLFCSRKCQSTGREKKKKILFEKKCGVCEKIFFIRKGYGGTGEYCSKECRAIGGGRKNSGANHLNWKGGISGRPHSVRKLIRDKIKKIGKCEECLSTNKLQGHHRLPVSRFPELIKDYNNIEILCVKCHSTKHPEIKNFINKQK